MVPVDVDGQICHFFSQRFVSEQIGNSDTDYFALIRPCISKVWISSSVSVKEACNKRNVQVVPSKTILNHKEAFFVIDLLLLNGA